MTAAVNVASLGTAMSADSSGNVGVGTTTPQTILNGIAAAARGVAIENGFPTLALSDTANSSYRTYIATDGGNAYFWNVAAGPTLFGTSDTERARITSGGDFLLNTTSFTGSGDTYRWSTGGVQLSRSANGDQIAFFTNGSLSGKITTSGTTTTYGTSSDYRLKNTIAPMIGALAKVALLKPVTYKWNLDNSDGQGFIAHELAEVCPDAVQGEKDAVDAEGHPEYQGIDVSFLVATLTAAIQEQQALITQQAAAITALTTRITVLEAP
jgi:hypothetical protein